MKDTQLYLIRVTYSDMILSDYFIGLTKVKNEVQRILRLYKNKVEKIEYGKAPYRSKGQWCNWDKSTIVVAYEK